MKASTPAPNSYLQRAEETTKSLISAFPPGSARLGACSGLTPSHINIAFRGQFPLDVIREELNSLPAVSCRLERCPSTARKFLPCVVRRMVPGTGLTSSHAHPRGREEQSWQIVCLHARWSTPRRQCAHGQCQTWKYSFGQRVPCSMVIEKEALSNWDWGLCVASGAHRHTLSLALRYLRVPEESSGGELLLHAVQKNAFQRFLSLGFQDHFVVVIWLCTFPLTHHPHASPAKKTKVHAVTGPSLSLS